MQRGILYIRTCDHLFCTSHLESYAGFVSGKKYTGAKEREKQVLEMERFCQQQLNIYPSLKFACIAGDLNWDDERTRSEGDNRELLKLLTDSRWVDAYLDSREKTKDPDTTVKKSTRKKPDGFTYDPKTNPMLGGGNLRRRFDRCLFLPQKKTSMNINKFQLIGKEAIPNLTYVKKTSFRGIEKSTTVPVVPSDHFGVVVSVQIN